MNSLSELQSFRGKKHKAYTLPQKACSIFEKNDAQIPIAYTYKTSEDADLRFYDVEKAIHYYDMASSIFRQVDALRGIAYTRVGLGESLAITVSPNASIPLYLDAMQKFRKQKIAYGVSLCKRRIHKHGYEH